MGRGRDGAGLVRAGEVEAGLPDAARRPAGRDRPAAALRRPGLLTPAALKAGLAARAGRLGFDLVRVTTPDAIPEARSRLAEWLAAGHHGSMAWMAGDSDRRGTPAGLWPDVRSIVMLGLSSAPDEDPMAKLARRDCGAVATYAARRDYHEVVKGRLKEIADWLRARAGADAKVFVDTAPVMEKPLAEAAGLGWIGKHSVLVSRAHGSWLILGAIFTTAALPPDDPESDHCGSCRRCLDVCPTDAFPAPYRLDARRCIAYLTIEHAGPIAPEFREAIGNRVFGCDDCLAVCPWNRFAAASRDARMALRQDLAAPPLAELARLDDAAFRLRFSGTPVKRTGRDRFVRNVLIAIGNSGDRTLAREAVRLLADPAPVVRGAAVWACGRLLPESEMLGLAHRHASNETDPDVLREWAGPSDASPLPEGEGCALSGEGTPSPDRTLPRPTRPRPHGRGKQRVAGAA